MKISRIRATIALAVALGMPLAGHAAAPAPKVRATIPFSLVAGRLLVHAEIDGHGPYAVLLDTSAGMSAIDFSVAHALRLPLGAKTVMAIDGAVPTGASYSTTLQTVSLGGHVGKNLGAVATDLTGLSKQLGVRIDGILDCDILERQIVDIDYPAHVMRFYARSLYPFATPAASATVAVMPFGYYDGLITNEVFAGQTQLVACIDTCEPSAFVLTQSAAAGLTLATSTAAGSVANVQTGYSALGEMTSAPVSRITVGTIVAPAGTVPVFSASSMFNDADWSIAVGTAFLQNCDVVIDDRDELLIITQH